MSGGGFNLTEEIRRELAAKGDARAAAGSGFEFWARCFIPDADEATATAKARGLIFGADARHMILSSVADARRCFHALTRDDDADAADAADYEETRAQSEAATARVNTCIDLACAALRGIAGGKGGAAKLARGAIADFLNCLAADDAEAATREAFRAANDAARAYFIERGEWNGGPKRKHLPSRLVEAGRGILAEMGLKPNRAGQIEGLQTAKVKAEFGRRLMAAGHWTDAGDADLPERLLAAIYDADRRAAKRKRKPH